MQDGGVIVYVSRKLKQHEEIYSTHDLELEVVTLALKLWRHFLVGRIFELKTDHEILKISSLKEISMLGKGDGVSL
jgi:hypothetical protein